MANIGRLVGVIAAVVLVVGAAIFLFFRSGIASEGLYRMQTAVVLDAAAPERHVVPEGFKGWVVVHYAVEGAPPLVEEDGAVILEYAATGQLDTSAPTPDDEGFLHRGYYRRTAGGLAPLSRVGDIWGEFSRRQFLEFGSEGAGRSSGFFVGSMTEFLDTEWPAEHGKPVGTQE